MYTYDERMRAVELYIQYDKQASRTVSALGYGSAKNIKRWYKEYVQTGGLHRNQERTKKYTDLQKAAAVQYYIEHGQNLRRTVKALGYPSRDLLREWLNEAIPERKNGCHVRCAMVKCSQEKKEQAVMDLCTRHGSAQEVADTHGVNRVTLYKWKHDLLGKECASMPREKPPSLDDVAALEKRIAELQEAEKAMEERLFRARLEYDILEKAAELLKKGEGIDLQSISNRQKAELIDALRDNYRLKDLLPILHISKSSYCYQAGKMKAPDKYEQLRIKVRTLFDAVDMRYGYRRIHAVLKNTGTIVSEKVVRRIMKEDRLKVRCAKRKKYSSYAGEISPEVANIINRDFHAETPNSKWLTDITEFSIPAGKVYLSPIIDCFDGLVVSWTIGVSPSAELANSMLDSAISTLKNGERPIVHSDRGCHYRWPGWIERMEAAKLIRSMSKKGCSPDNSACEGFFGRLKNEMFYGRSWQDVSIEDFIDAVNTYIYWYNEGRIKESLGWMSPMEYRRSLGLAA